MIIQKPWGREWLFYESPLVACWMLEIEAGMSTSFHSHPGKLTGYVVVEGALRLSFLNSGQVLAALDKAVIHPYVPHRSTALTGCRLIEVECPKDHDDLIRFEDEYGRANEPQEKALEQALEAPRLAQDEPVEFGHVTIGLSRLTPGTGYSGWISAIPDRTAVAVMAGQLVDRRGVGAVVPGHVVWGKDLKRLAGSLELREPMEVLVAWETRQSAI